MGYIALIVQIDYFLTTYYIFYNVFFTRKNYVTQQPFE
jgi:hypothetical protein